MNEQALAAYIDQYMSRRYDRLITNQFFRGTITSAVRGPRGGWVCSILRSGAKTTDQGAYLCATPGYSPQVGDDVECVWRDQSTGYVLWPTNASKGLGALGILPGGYVKVITSQGPTAPPFDLTGLTRTVTLYSGRRYRISAQALITSSVATDGIQLGIAEDGSLVMQANESASTVVSGTNRAAVFRECPGDVAAGTHIYKLSARRNGGGTGNFTNNAGASFPSWIAVEDVGPVN